MSDGCIITGAAITNSVIGLRSRISQRSAIDSSFMMGADYYQTIEEMRDDLLSGMPRVGIGEGTVISRAIIDKNARIGSEVRLAKRGAGDEADGPTAPITFAMESSSFPRMRVEARYGNGCLSLDRHACPSHLALEIESQWRSVGANLSKSRSRKRTSVPPSSGSPEFHVGGSVTAATSGVTEALAFAN